MKKGKKKMIMKIKKKMILKKMRIMQKKKKKTKMKTIFILSMMNIILSNQNYLEKLNQQISLMNQILIIFIQNFKKTKISKKEKSQKNLRQKKKKWTKYIMIIIRIEY